MAKDLPYFKFFCSEWTDGDITLESFEVQGLFINVCSYYWSNECDVNLDKLKKKFKGSEKIIDLLIGLGIIKIKSNLGEVIISFLDEQRSERKSKSVTNSLNGSKGGRPKKETENKPNALNSLTETKGNKKREEEKREEEKRELSYVEKRAKFIIWFNNQKKKHTGTLGRFKILSNQDDNNLKKLFKDYSFSDFEIAIENLFISKWAIENNGLTPSHFLRIDNFNKYLNQVKTVKRLNTFD